MTDSNPKAPSRARRIGRRIALGLGAVLVVGAVVFMAGPRYEMGAPTPTPRDAPPESLVQLDDWLLKQESRYSDLRPNAEKMIAWHSAVKAKTPWAVVNIHGFSASRMETAPVADVVAKALGANRFETRLAGHGRSGAAMAEATPQDWFADTLEAARIGHALGDKVLMIGTSTGGTLEAWLAMRPEGEVVDAYVFISPNFGPNNPQSNVAYWPWGLQIVHAAFGETRDWTTDDPRINQAFTTRYPFKAILPMMGLVRHVKEMDLSAFKTPVLVLYSERDDVIDTGAVKKAFAQIGSNTKELKAIDYSTDKNQHVLASELHSPSSVGPLTDTIIQWLKTLPASSK